MPNQAPQAQAPELPDVDSEKLAATKKILLGGIAFLTIIIIGVVIVLYQKISSNANPSSPSSTPVQGSGQAVPKYVAPSGATTSPTTTTTPTPSPSTTSTPTPTPTTSGGSGSGKGGSTGSSTLTCQSVTFTQNGNSVTQIQMNSSPVTITVNVKDSSSSATINYNNSLWTISPNDSTASSLAPTGNNAVWTPPTTISGSSQNYTFSISQITDSSNNKLASPCTGTITVEASLGSGSGSTNPTPTTTSTTPTPTSTNGSGSTSGSSSSGNLPNTGIDSYTFEGIGLGLILIFSGMFFFKKRKTRI